MARRRVILSAGALAESTTVIDVFEPTVRHLKVLRLRTGDPIEVTDGEGWVAQGHIDQINKTSARFAIDAVAYHPPPAGPHLILLQGIGKGDKLDHVVRQVGELGASKFIPVGTERTVATREHRAPRLRSIADDALRVSRSAHRMVVEEPMGLSDALRVDKDVGVVLAAESDCSIRAVLEATPSEAHIAFLVGPEGGLTSGELKQAEALGFCRAHIGPYILRTETAGAAVIAMARYAFI